MYRALILIYELFTNGSYLLQLYTNYIGILVLIIMNILYLLKLNQVGELLEHLFLGKLC